MEKKKEKKTSGKLDFYVFTLYSIFPFKLMIHHHQYKKERASEREEN
jgi:hypothetical protein